MTALQPRQGSSALDMDGLRRQVRARAAEVHVRAAAEKAKGIINGTDSKPAVLRHRLLSKGSEGLLSCLEGAVAHCIKFQAFGGWHAAGSAQEVADAALALVVEVGECKNRDQVAETLLEAGWTYFEYYIFQEELSKGRVPTFG